MSVSAWRRRQREIFDRVQPPAHPMAPHVPSNVPTWPELVEFVQGLDIAEREVGEEDEEDGDGDAEVADHDIGTDDEGGDEEEAADLEAEEAAIRELKSQSWLERRLRWGSCVWVCIRLRVRVCTCVDMFVCVLARLCVHVCVEGWSHLLLRCVGCTLVSDCVVCSLPRRVACVSPPA